MKILSKYLFCAFIALAFCGNAFAVDGESSSSSLYEIGSCDDLIAFAAMVNSSNSNADAKLTQSIDCSGKTFDPIGTSGHPYTGTFDGDGFSIRNLQVSNKTYAGLFGYIGKNAKVQYVFLDSAQISGKTKSTSTVYVGGIAAYNAGGTIYGCVVENSLLSGAVGGSGTTSYAGGIVGRMDGGKIELCNVTSTVSVQTTSSAGGVIGYLNSGTVTNCLSSAKVQSVAKNADGYAGGIAGSNKGTITRCVYTGNSVIPGGANESSGGAIVGKKDDTKCTETCYYTQEGLTVGSADLLNTDVENIKKRLSDPWDTMEEDLILRPYETGSPLYPQVTFDLSAHNGESFVRNAGKDHLVAEPARAVVEDGGAYYGTFEWYKDAETTNIWKFASDKVYGEMTLYPTWISVYKVSFDANGGTWPNDAVKEKFYAQNESITADGISTPTKTVSGTTYKVVGWNASSSASSASSNLGTMGTSAKTFFAVWAVSGIKTLTYNKGTATSASGDDVKQNLPEGVSIVLKGPLFERSSYFQTGWSINSRGSSKDYLFEDSYTGNADKILYPYWTSSASAYKVTYKPGTNVTGSEFVWPVEKNKTSKLSITTFSRNNYIQDGWSISENADDKDYDLGESYTAVGDIILYPHWVQSSYTISYVLNNGTNNSDNPDSYTTTTSDITLENPTRTGYIFDGWYDNADYTGNAVTKISQGSSGDKTFWAKWKMDVSATAYVGTYDGESHNITVSAPSGASITYSETQTGTYSADFGKTAAGTYTVYYKVTQSGYDDVTSSSTITINAKEATNLTVTVENTTYTGEELTPTVVVKDGSTLLTEDTDYTVSLSSTPKDVGVYTVTVTGKGNYSSSTTASFIVSPVVDLNLGNAKLVCTDGATGATFCNAEGTGINHVYNTETTLPDAIMVNGSDEVDDSWTFGGWFSNDAFTGTAVTKIAKDETKAVDIYPKLTKDLTITLWDDPKIEVTIVLDNNDNADSVKKKVNAAYESSNPENEPSKNSDDKYDYTFKEFTCTESGSTYSCDADFTSSARVFELATDLDENVRLVCTGDAAANCNTEKTAIKHKYGEETKPLPDAVIVKDDEGTEVVDESWIFEGWFDNKDGLNDKITSIDAEAYGDNPKIYPYFTKTIKANIAGTIREVVIDNNDNQDDINAKVSAAAAEEPAIVPAEKSYMDPEGFYVFDGYTCVVSENPEVSDYECDSHFVKANFESIVAVNLPVGARLVCEGDPLPAGAENCNVEKNGIVHLYGIETTPLPSAEIEGDDNGPWTFAGWYEEDDGEGEKVSSIPAEYYGENLVIYPYFTKKIVAIIGEEMLEVDIDLNDGEDDINKKVSEAAENHDPKIEPENTVIQRSPEEDVFTGYSCALDELEKDTYNCTPKYETRGITFTVAVNLPENAKLVCSGEAANNCTEDENNIKHQYGVKTTPLPDAVIIDAEGQIDESWTFNGWFENAGGVGEKVEYIDEESSEGISIYPYFTKELEVAVSDDSEIIVDLPIVPDDDVESAKTKLDEAIENLEEKPETPTKESSEKYDYTFKDYDCWLEGASIACGAVFDSTGRVFKVVSNLPDNAMLVCSEGAPGAKFCSEDGLSIEHQFGVTTDPIPDAVIVDANKQVDESWTFEGWFDNENGIGDNVDSLLAEEYGSIVIYPFFTKDLEIVLSKNPEVKVTIVLDNNDIADSVSKKVNEAYDKLSPKPDTPTKEESNGFKYEFVGFDCDNNFVCKAVFDSTEYGLEVVVAYGNGPRDTIHVLVKNHESEEDIEMAIAEAFKNHEPKLPTPTKADELLCTYKFDKFVKNQETGMYEPEFTTVARTFDITFNMPSEAKLEAEMESYSVGESVTLPAAVIKDSKWEFKGWYTKANGNGTRVKAIKSTDIGDLKFYAFFQMSVPYEVNGKKAYVEVPYGEDVDKLIENALDGVIPKDYEKNGKAYTFAKWNKVKDVYVAEFKPVGIAASRIPMFNVVALGRVIEISGAKIGAKIAVFDMQGHLMVNGIVENGTQRVELAKSGSYVVRVNNQVARVNVR